MKKNPIKTIRYRIGKSGIHGRGTFATEDIRKNTRIVEYLGKIVTDEDLDDRPEDPDFVWLFDLEDGRYIDGNRKLPGPCVNHSCEPNCFTEIIDGRVFIVSDRKISTGEELTYDYSFEHDTNTHLCACGSPKCRGTINLKPPRKRSRNGSGTRRKR
jgi:hypothetical protein